MSNVEQFTDLYTTTYPRVVTYLTRKTNNLEDAEDLAEETFLRMWEKRDRINDDIFPRYAFRVARNVWIDHVRGIKGRRGDRIPSSPLEEDYPSQDDPVKEVETNMLAQKIRDAVTCLPPYCYKAIVGHYFQDMSFSELSQQTHISEGSLKSSAFQAREKLREVLAEEL